MTGAAPVPVPPPRPVVTKIMSAPDSAWMIDVGVLERGLPADVRIGAGAEPLRQLVTDLQLDRRRDCDRAPAASVLATMNSTPPRPTSTIRLTALLPPPPTPTTLILRRGAPHVERQSQLLSRPSRRRNHSCGLLPAPSSRLENLTVRTSEIRKIP